MVINKGGIKMGYGFGPAPAHGPAKKGFTPKKDAAPGSGSPKKGAAPKKGVAPGKSGKKGA
jgi:hypothetical protein